MLLSCKGLKAELQNAKRYLDNFYVALDQSKKTRNKKGLSSKLFIAKAKLNAVWGFLYPAIADLRQMDDWHNLNPRDFWRKFKREGFEHSLKNRKLVYDYDVIVSQKYSTGILLGNIIIKGKLQVTSLSKLNRLPDNIVVAGDCEIEGHNLDVLPSGFRVWGNLSLGHIVRYLQDDLEVGGDLHIPEHLEEQALKLKEAGQIKGELYIKY